MPYIQYCRYMGFMGEAKSGTIQFLCDSDIIIIQHCCYAVPFVYTVLYYERSESINFFHATSFIVLSVNQVPSFPLAAVNGLR